MDVSFPVRSIAPNDEDFHDLEPLVDLIGDRRFVLLAPGGVLVISDEDSLSTICQNLQANGGDLQRVFILDRSATARLTLPSGIESLESSVVQHDVRLVVFDPVTAFLEGNLHNDQSVRRALGPLSAVAQRTGCAIVLVRHLRKGTGSALYRGAGSIGLVAAARSGLLVARHPADESQRVVAQHKSSLGPLAISLSFSLVAEEKGLVVEWHGPASLTAQQISVIGKTDDESALGEAVYILYSLLAEGPLAANDAKKRAAQSGIANRTLRRAKELLGVRSQRIGFGKGSRLYWELPPESELVAQLHAQDIDELANKLFHSHSTSPSDSDGGDRSQPDKKAEDDEPPLEV